MSTLPRKTLLFALLGLGAVCWAVMPGEQAPTATVAAASAPVSQYRVSGPFTHENLSVFLLHGPDTLPPRPILTLDEALAKNQFVVHETGTVNTLMVENQSSDGDVLIQPGDIVKGGKQDRLIAAAMLVPANSGPIAVPSFCVEAGRWTQRGSEVASRFAENRACISGKDLKNAALVNGQQSEVWANVKQLQDKLSANVGKPVNCPDSPTSLQLALESAAVVDKLKGYEQALGSVLRGSKGAVGFVVAVNGQVTGAEVFGSSAVLAKAWPKALRSAAVEALAERNGKAFEPCNGEAVLAFLTDAEKGQAEPVAAATGQQETAFGIAPGRGASQLPRELNRVEIPVDRVNQNQAGTADVIREVQDLLETSPRQTAANPQPQGRNPDSLRDNPRTLGIRSVVRPAPVQVNRVQGRQAVLVESRDAAKPASVIHRSYIAK